MRPYSRFLAIFALPFFYVAAGVYLAWLYPEGKLSALIAAGIFFALAIFRIAVWIQMRRRPPAK